MKYNYLKLNLCKVLISVCPWMSVQIWNVRWIFLLIDDCGYLYSYSPFSTHNPSSFGIGNEVGYRASRSEFTNQWWVVSFSDYTSPAEINMCAPDTKYNSSSFLPRIVVLCRCLQFHSLTGIVIVTSHGLIGFASSWDWFMSAATSLFVAMRLDNFRCISGDQRSLRMQEIPFRRP